jgi:hypothetical protein
VKITSEMSFDPETIQTLKTALDEAWASLVPAQQAMTPRSLLAERILKVAAGGERDPIRLRASALIGLVHAKEAGDRRPA